MSLPQSKSEKIIFGSIVSLGVIVSLAVVVVLFFLIRAGGVFVSSVSLKDSIFFDQWFPTEQLFGLGPMIIGSASISLMALALSGPLALMLAFFYFYISPAKLRSFLDISMDIFLAIPSVVFGLWGFVVLVPLISPIFPPGQSLLTASIVLSFLILPIGFKTFVSIFQTVPEEWLLAAKSTNLSSWTVFYDLILKNYSRKLVVGFLLQSTRAVGETMAVLMVCGNIIQYPDSLFSPIRTLTTNIALEMSYATGIHRTSLFFCGLLLIVFIFSGLLISQNNKEKV